MNIKNFFFCFVAFISFFKISRANEMRSDHIITVFVHGTTLARKLLQHTPYRHRIFCSQGLTLATALPHNYHFHKMAQSCAQFNPNRYSLEHFYIFGWKSEHVHHTNRVQAAQDLIQALQPIIQNYYNQYQQVPSLQLIGFSHGGNVILNTAPYLPLTVENKKVDVQIWLFGTPVQQINHEFVNSPSFTKVHSIYSKKDWMQRIDPQGWSNRKCRKYYFWSDRTFDPNSQCVQVDFTVNNKSISHMQYRQLFHHLPIIQEHIEAQSASIKSGIIAVNVDI